MEANNNVNLSNMLRDVSLEELIKREVAKAFKGLFKKMVVETTGLDEVLEPVVAFEDYEDDAPEVVNAKLDSENICYNENRARDLHQLLRDLKGPVDGFDPRTEAEFDDVSELWEKQAKGFGYAPELLKFAIIHVGSRRIQDAIDELGVMSEVSRARPRSSEVSER